MLNSGNLNSKYSGIAQRAMSIDGIELRGDSICMDTDTTMVKIEKVEISSAWFHVHGHGYNYSQNQESRSK